MASKGQFSNYSVQSNTIDLTTVGIDSENKGYLVDRKLVDMLLKQVIGIPFEEAKEAIIAHLQTAQNFDEMVASFNESIYVHQVVGLFEASEKPSVVMAH